MNVTKFYTGKTILLTGSTGFVGKVLLQKLLFSCPEVFRIYVLIRNKKGLTLNQRFRREVVSSVCYDRLRNHYGHRFQEFINDKVVPIQGDLNVPGIGIKEGDRRKLISQVDCIISVAASVDFNAPLNQAIKTNILGVCQLLTLAKQSERLISFTHMSTCYVNTNQPQGPIQQRIYSQGTDPQNELKVFLSMSVDELLKETQTIIKGYPNTYTFTKNLCQRILQKRREKVSLTIVRPSIICSSYKQPLVGWVDSVVAVGAIYLYGGVGILKHLHCQPQKVGDLIPVDIVVNYTIVANVLHAGKGQLNVHHCGSSHLNPIDWNAALVGSRAYFIQNPPEIRAGPYQVYLIPSGSLTKIRQFSRKVPAMVLQKMAQKFGSQKLKKDSRKFLKQLQKAQLINEVFQFFMNHQYFFQMNHLDQMVKLGGDKFALDVTQVDMEYWVCISVYGIHKFILKQKVGEPPSRDILTKQLQVKYFDDINWSLSQSVHTTKRKSHFKQIVLKSNAVQQAINLYAKNSVKKGISFEKGIKQARQLALQASQTILGDSQVSKIRMFAWSLHKIFKRIFQRIQIRKDQLQLLKGLDVPMILLPNHRSYIDYVLIAYICFSHGIKLPLVASDNSISNIFLLSSLMRGSGAFQIDRKRYNQQPLYKTIFDQYVKQLLSEGNSIQHFLQGTRSRTGKILQPNFELMNVAFKGIVQGRYQDVALVPVTISYQKVIQGDTFPLQLLGQQKVQESFIRMIKSIKLLKENYGCIYVDFQKPVMLSQYIQPDLNSETSVSNAVYDILHSINQNTVIMPVSLVSTIMLLHRKGISQDQLARKVNWLYRLILQRGYRIGGVNQIAPRATIRFVLGLLKNILNKTKHNVFELSLQPGREYQSILLLSYYRNMLVHIFINEAVVCVTLAAFSAKTGASTQLLAQQIKFVSTILKREIIVRDQISGKNYRKIIEQMQQRQIIQVQKDVVSISKTGEECSAFMCSLLYPVIESYWATLSYLLSLSQKMTQMKINSFIEQVQWYAQTMHDQRIMDYYQSCSIETIRNAVQAFKQCKLFNVRQGIISGTAKQEQIIQVQNRIRKLLRPGFGKQHQRTKL